MMTVMMCIAVLKLLKLARSVRALLDTVMQALPEVGNLGLLFFLLFYIFAALGVELFGRVGQLPLVWTALELHLCATVAHAPKYTYLFTSSVVRWYSVLDGIRKMSVEWRVTRQCSLIRRSLCRQKSS